MSRKSAKRLDEKLWERIREKYRNTEKYGGKGWNARKAQLAVKEYKSLGGRYDETVPRAKTSLHKWTQEKWDYAGKAGDSRYLPEAVRERLTKAERAAENRRKRGKKGQYIPYTRSVRKKLKRAGVLSRKGKK